MKKQNNAQNGHNGSELDKSLGFMVNILARSMKTVLENKLKEYGVTLTQWLVLQGVSELDEGKQTELGKKLDLDNATITRNLDRLEDVDLLKRSQVEGDRRAQSLSLTPKGMRLLPKLNDAANDVNKLAGKGIRIAEVRKLVSDLTTMRKNIEELS